MGAVGDVADRQVDELARVGEHELADPLFGGGQGGERGLDAVEHGWS